MKKKMQENVFDPSSREAGGVEAHETQIRPGLFGDAGNMLPSVPRSVVR